MITLLFVLLLIGFILKIIGVAFKASWGLVKIILTAVVFPVVLIGLVIGGLVTFAIPLLIIAGVVLIIRGVRAA